MTSGGVPDAPSPRTPASIDVETLSPAGLLAAWRAAERRSAVATPGTDEAATAHAEMRWLMDAYEWRVRGGVPAAAGSRGRR